jgi:hypothetical protein
LFLNELVLSGIDQLRTFSAEMTVWRPILNCAVAGPCRHNFLCNNSTRKRRREKKDED